MVGWPYQWRMRSGDDPFSRQFIGMSDDTKHTNVRWQKHKNICCMFCPI